MQSQSTQSNRSSHFSSQSWRQNLWLKNRDSFEGYLFIAPFLFVYIIFLIYPFFKGIWISLHEWNLLAVAFNPDAKEFIGLQNYRDMLWGRGMTWGLDNLLGWRLLGLAMLAPIWWSVQRGALRSKAAIWLSLSIVLLFGVILGIHPGDDGRWYDRRFWSIVWNTLAFVLLTVPLVTSIGLGLAIALNRQSPIMALFRTIFFLSQVLSVTVVTLIWQMIFSPSQGIISNLLQVFGLEPITWITNERLAMPAIVIATVWWSMGFAMVVFLAGLQEIPTERYEAARLDGAGPWSLLRHITLPGIRRTTTLVVILQIILHFQVFGQSHLITRGGPNDSTQVLVRYIYQTAFRDSELGYASGLAVLLFVIMLIFSVIQLRLNREEGV